MKKIYYILMLIAITLLSGCQSPSERGREIVYDIYESHTYIVKADVSWEDDFYYSGFSSYTKASDDGFKLILLKNDIYSELIFEWQDFINNEVTIESIKIIYYDFENEIYFSIESEEADGLVYDEISYDKLLSDFSKIRIDDIQWILTNLGYEIK